MPFRLTVRQWIIGCALTPSSPKLKSDCGVKFFFCQCLEVILKEAKTSFGTDFVSETSLTHFKNKYLINLHVMIGLLRHPQ